MTRVLVVGATGILAPAAAELVASGETVTGMARNPHGMPAGVEPLVVDGRDAGAVRSAVEDRRWDAALVYCPAVTAETLAVLQGAADRIVEVRTSAAADPAHRDLVAADDLVAAGDVLQLGWQPGEAGARWHTPREVSEAALEVLADGAGRVLGAVRPWSDRP